MRETELIVSFGDVSVVVFQMLLLYVQASIEVVDGRVVSFRFQRHFAQRQETIGGFDLLLFGYRLLFFLNEGIWDKLREKKWLNIEQFLVACYATQHPALSVRPSVRLSVCSSVRSSVCPLVHSSVRHTLLYFLFADFCLNAPAQMMR